MIVGAFGRHANATNLLSQAGQFLLTVEEATRLVDAMEAQVSKSWLRVARAAGVSPKDCDAIRRAFDHPGFRLAPE